MRIEILAQFKYSMINAPKDCMWQFTKIIQAIVYVKCSGASEFYFTKSWSGMIAKREKEIGRAHV